MKYRLFGEEHWVEAIDREATHRQLFYARVDIGNEHLSTYGGEPGTFAAELNQARHVLYRLRSYADEFGSMRTVYELPVKHLSRSLLASIIGAGGRVENIESETGLYIEIATDALDMPVPVDFPDSMLVYVDQETGLDSSRSATYREYFGGVFCENTTHCLVGFPPLTPHSGSLERIPLNHGVVRALVTNFPNALFYGPWVPEKIGADFPG